ncbi:MAG: hypothetical protein IJH39_07550 [Clostridia bacterium]|nr:hypothetical protein [Clostridia bacterium]
MKKEDVLKEYGIEFAIETITPLIKQKMEEYKETRDSTLEKELANLLKDRDEIYNNNVEIIKKYVRL